MEEFISFIKQAHFLPQEIKFHSFQIEIFWRRALFADGCKVHCLVNADLLDYEISDKGEKSLERHMNNAQFQGMPSKIYAHFTNNGVRRV